MAALPVASTILGSAPPASSCSTMRSLPLNAAAAMGVTPERPARSGAAPLFRSKATLRGRAGQVAGMDGGRLVQVQDAQIGPPFPCGMRERHRAQTVPGLQRGSVIEQTAGEKLATFVGRQE